MEEAMQVTLLLGGVLIAVLPFLAGLMVLEHIGKRMEAGWKARAEVSDQQMAALARSLESVERRMKSLETILDDEAPGWRKRHETVEG